MKEELEYDIWHACCTTYNTLNMGFFSVERIYWKHILADVFRQDINFSVFLYHYGMVTCYVKRNYAQIGIFQRTAYHLFNWNVLLGRNEFWESENSLPVQVIPEAVKTCYYRLNLAYVIFFLIGDTFPITKNSIRFIVLQFQLFFH